MYVSNFQKLIFEFNKKNNSNFYRLQNIFFVELSLELDMFGPTSTAPTSAPP